MSDVMDELKAIAKAVNGLIEIESSLKIIEPQYPAGHYLAYSGLKESGLAIKQKRDSDKFPCEYYLIVDGVRLYEISED